MRRHLQSDTAVSGTPMWRDAMNWLRSAITLALKKLAGNTPQNKAKFNTHITTQLASRVA